MGKQKRYKGGISGYAAHQIAYDELRGNTLYRIALQRMKEEKGVLIAKTGSGAGTVFWYDEAKVRELVARIKREANEYEAIR